MAFQVSKIQSDGQGTGSSRYCLAVNLIYILHYRTGGKFRGWKISCNSRFCLRKFRGLIPPSTCIIFVSSATHEKREIKTTSKFSTRTVYHLQQNVSILSALFELLFLRDVLTIGHALALVM